MREEKSKIYSDMFKSLQNLQIYGLAKPSTVLNLLYELTGKNESISRYNLDDYFIQFNFKNSGMNKKLMSISVEKGDKIIYESKGFTEKYTAIPDKGEMKKLLEKIEKIKINSNKNVDNNTITNIYRMWCYSYSFGKSISFPSSESVNLFKVVITFPSLS